MYRLKPVWLLILIASLAVVLTVLITERVAQTVFLNEVRTRAAATLELHAANLLGSLDKYRALPALLAQRPDVLALYDPAAGQTDRAAAQLAGVQVVAGRMAALTGARAIHFYDRDGALIISSRANASFFAGPIGLQAFQAALQGRLGRTYSMRSQDDTAILYGFAHAVRVAGQVRGVVAIEIELDGLEEAWALDKNPVLALDQAGRVVLSNQPCWRYRRVCKTDQSPAAGMNPAGAASDHAASRPDGADKPEHAVLFPDIKPASFYGFGTVDPTLFALRLPQVGREEPFRTYMRLERPIALLGWRVQVYADIGTARAQVLRAVLLAVTLCFILILSLWLVYERRRRLVLAVEHERAESERLERRVVARTEELRQAQAELVQAAKLAALGQMSASLSHEFNQPLSAIRSFSDNALTFLERERPDKARATLERIIKVVDRLAELSRLLKTFARKPGSKTQPVSLKIIVDETMMLVRAKVRKMGAEVITSDIPDDLWVAAGHIRLEQVIVNLVSNGLDAMAGHKHPRMVISTRDEGEMVALLVDDAGPGVPEDMRPRIFDPFYTTKEVGEGLGLGLSIAYNIIRDFNGSIEVQDSALGGARFSVRLPKAVARPQPAEKI